MNWNYLKCILLACLLFDMHGYHVQRTEFYFILNFAVGHLQLHALIQSVKFNHIWPIEKKAISIVHTLITYLLQIYAEHTSAVKETAKKFGWIEIKLRYYMAGWLSGRVIAQVLKSLRFKPLPRQPVVEVIALHLHLASVANISIMLLSS